MNPLVTRLSQLRRRPQLQVTVCEAGAEACTPACRAAAHLDRTRTHAIAQHLLAR